MLPEKRHLKFPLRGKCAFPPLTFTFYALSSKCFVLSEQLRYRDHIFDPGKHFFTDPLHFADLFRAFKRTVLLPESNDVFRFRLPDSRKRDQFTRAGRIDIYPSARAR